MGTIDNILKNQQSWCQEQRSTFLLLQNSTLHKDGRPVESKGAGRKVLDRVQKFF